MNSPFDFEAYLAQAREHLAILTASHQGMWGIDQCDTWNADQDTGILSWAFDDGKIVRAEFQIVGTYNSLDGTFLWGWDHPSVLEPLRADASQVLEFAKSHGIESLEERISVCSEDEAWGYTALATLLCSRQGAYRGPAGTTYVFMTFGEVTISKNPE